MKVEKIPLLEFDENKTAKMSPAHFEFLPKGLPERCVIAFSRSSVERIAEKYNAKLLGRTTCCTGDVPIYAIDLDGTTVALTVGFLGSAGAAGQIEELHAGGVKKIVACGACGTLMQKPLGALVVPNAAVRDEGTSFHYAPPSYEIESDRAVIAKIGETLTDMGIPFVFGKTWTTDAFYRETEEKIALRRSQGCITVEMECSAMTAVAKFHGIEFGQILYCGDDLSGDEYDHRNFSSAKEVRRNLAEYALRCAKAL